MKPTKSSTNDSTKYLRLDLPCKIEANFKLDEIDENHVRFCRSNLWYQYN